MLKIRNRETGEVADLNRDVCTTHPAWVHEQCGTASESELQQMIDAMSYHEFAQNPDSEDGAGVFMEADTAKDYLGEIAAREYHAERFDD